MKLNNKIKWGFSSLMLFVSNTLSAQVRDVGRVARGKKGIEDAVRDVQGYFEPIVQLVYVVAAIIGLIGAIKVYGKFSKGDPDTGTTAAQWFGAALFLVIAVTVLKAVLLD
nr:DUF4134 domain-containing protein [Porphyromonas levii]